MPSLSYAFVPPVHENLLPTSPFRLAAVSSQINLLPASPASQIQASYEYIPPLSTTGLQSSQTFITSLPGPLQDVLLPPQPGSFLELLSQGPSSSSLSVILYKI